MYRCPWIGVWLFFWTAPDLNQSINNSIKKLIRESGPKVNYLTRQWVRQLADETINKEARIRWEEKVWKPSEWEWNGNENENGTEMGMGTGMEWEWKWKVQYAKGQLRMWTSPSALFYVNTARLLGNVSSSSLRDPRVTFLYVDFFLLIWIIHALLLS